MWDDFDIRDLNSNQQSSAKTSNDSDLDFWKNFDFPYLGDDGLTQDIACSALKFPIDINGLVAPSSSVQSLPDSSTVPATWMPQHQESQATLIDSAYVSQFMSSLNAHKMQSLPLLETNIQSKPNTQDDATTRKRKETSTEKLDPTEKRRRNTEASQRFRAKKKAQNEAIARQAQELESAVEELKLKIKEQQMEIQWLRSLITERDFESHAKKSN